MLSIMSYEFVRTEDIMNFDFKPILLEDKQLIDSYIKQQSSRNCSISFANIYLWQKHYQIEYAIIEDMLVFKSIEEPPVFSYPIGGDNVKNSIDTIMQYCKENNFEFKMYGVSEEQFEVIEQLYPGEFEVEYNRDEANYVYETEKLINLSGKKYHSKKNHVNKFKIVHEDWQYEDITDDNLEDSIEMAMEWRKANMCVDDEKQDICNGAGAHDMKSAEFCVTLNALKKLKELGLTGGLIRAEGKVVAITVGEELTKDTFVVHIEKAFADVDGAYAMINREFLAHHATEYMYVNREEDTGEEGLRKAKLSYKPVFMVESGVVSRIIA